MISSFSIILSRPGGMGETVGRTHAYNFFSLQHWFFDLGCTGRVKGDAVAIEVNHHSRRFVRFKANHSGNELFIDLLAGIHDLLEQS
ncbi:MAG: hypothetical protein CM15mP130_0400 [Verrucomicrobiota bacterium]|nr:MAG: hypothetical protein CM15mP130_0400 [Verrucomicrobiota bacterium]